MRAVAAFAALAAGLFTAGCMGEDDLGATHAGVYTSEVQSVDCRFSWFIGADEFARYSCTADGYRMALKQRGQATSVTIVPQAKVMRVDAIVQILSPAASNASSDPGIACLWDRRFGWLAEIGEGSRYYIVPYGEREPLAKGTSPAIRPLAQRNHLVTCDAGKSGTRISLSVNGTVVAQGVDAGSAVRFSRFGMWTAGEAGAALLVRRIGATTR